MLSGSQPALPDTSTELFTLVADLDDGANLRFEEVGPRPRVGAISVEGIEEALQEEPPLQKSDLGGNEQ